MLQNFKFMRNSKFYTLISLLFILSTSCSRTSMEINEYSKKLQVNFPSDMDLVYYNEHSDFQDYSIHSIYTLSFNQKNALLEEIVENLCDVHEEKNKHYSYWHRCGDFFSYEYNNTNEGVKIKVIFIAKNNERLLNIYEVKM